jgi:dUTP pyrophosphatase
MTVNSGVVRVKLLRDGAQLPEYMTACAVGMDISALVESPVRVSPMGMVKVPTGIAIEVPFGLEAQLRPRSGLAIKHGITLSNSPGTIDPDYRGEICVGLINLGGSDFVVETGMRIAQMVISPVAIVAVMEVNHLSNTERGSGGFGSTGK